MRVFSSLLIISAAVTLSACGGGGDSTSPGGSTNPGNTAPVQTNAVGVADDNFTPPSIVVSAGTTVTWTWAPGASTHNVTFDDGTTSGDRSPASGPFSRTFASVGTFNYHCTIHPGMTGLVTVQ
jgi:plastocyanin